MKMAVITAKYPNGLSTEYRVCKSLFEDGFRVITINEWDRIHRGGEKIYKTVEEAVERYMFILGLKRSMGYIEDVSLRIEEEAE